MKVTDPVTGKGCRFLDRTGQRNGRLVFLRHLGLDAHKHHIWEAICDCGVTTRTASPHRTKSCGCLQRDVAAETQKAKALPVQKKIENKRRSAALQREKRKSSETHAMQARLSGLHRHALKRVGASKSSPTFEQLGYTVAEFVAHMERQFTEGMGWHNISEWEIDHIVPSSEARTIDDVVALNQLSNLRPLWAKENNAKKARRVSLL